MKIGITGSSGVLGSILLKKLKKKKCTIIIFNSDIQKSLEVNKWVKKNNFDAIFHLAAIVPVKVCNENPLLTCSVNIGGVYNILESLIGLEKKPWFFYASTSHVYKIKNKPLLETDPIFPKTFYGYTKWIGEKIIKNFSEIHNLPYCCGRIFSFYDKSQSKDFLFSSAKEKIKRLSDKKFIHVMNAHSIIDIQKAEDVVKIILKLFEKKFQGTVNVGTGKGISIKNFVKKTTKKKIKVLTNTKKKTLTIASIKKLNLFINQ
ncbi:SDR family oxidoreductase [Candidatus Pelagibacter bacterium]|nr:SDR family oxidoreductase [Candidatus Pelagibacter bacterium]MDA8801449.1 SDR family oxidoreductase [Candidatus Pelagibacter bacterium]